VVPEFKSASSAQASDSVAACLAKVTASVKVERRLDPRLGGRAVTYDEMVREYGAQGQNVEYWQHYWQSLQVATDADASKVSSTSAPASNHRVKKVVSPAGKGKGSSLKAEFRAQAESLNLGALGSGTSTEVPVSSSANSSCLAPVPSWYLMPSNPPSPESDTPRMEQKKVTVTQAERRVDPLLGGRAVTFEQMVRENAALGRPAGWLTSHWDSLQVDNEVIKV